MNKQVYDQKPTYRRNKNKTGYYSNLGNVKLPTGNNNNPSMDLIVSNKINLLMSGDNNQLEACNATSKKPNHVENKQNGGKQKNATDSGGKQKGRRNGKKAANQKQDQQLAGIISTPASSHQPLRIPSKGMNLPLVRLDPSDQAFWTEMDSESKALEIKKILNIDWQPWR